MGFDGVKSLDASRSIAAMKYAIVFHEPAIAAMELQMDT